MGGATKIFTLSTAPLLLYHRRFLLLAAFSFRISNVLFSPRNFASLSPFPSHRHGFGGIRALRRCLHSQYALRDNRFSDPNEQGAPLTWPEWSRFIDCLASCGYFNRNDGVEEGFTSVVGLSEEFLRAARCCLAFARDRPDVLRLLWRKDVETITENGAPFLFKNGDESAWRMRSFLSSGESNVLASDMAQTLDLMRFLLSYMSKPALSLEGGATFNNDFVGSSVRHLLNELIQVIHTGPGSNSSASAARQYPRQTSRPQGENIEMKKGGWICPRCDFYNSSRKVVCLGCDCKQPGENLFGSRPAFGFGNNSNFNKDDSGLAPEENKEERWVKKASSIDCTSDMNNVIADKDYPEIMPLSKGVNRFVVSSRKTPLERRLVNFHNQGNFGHDQNLKWSDSQAANNLNATFSICLNELLDQTSAHSETHSSNSDVGMPPVYSRNVENMFGSRPSFGFGNNSNFNRGDSGLAPEEDKEELLWFRKASALACTSDMNNVIADKGYPEIMPQRKGVSRFVVSPRKTPLEKRLVYFYNEGNLGHDQNLEWSDSQAAKNNLNATFSIFLGELLDWTSAHSETHYNSSNSDVDCEKARPKRQLTGGEWECPQCNFMNFKRNMKCLECEEERPKRKLVAGEWECPQCNFMNFVKNMKCLQCEEAQPKRKLTSGEWECPQCNFLNFRRNMKCCVCEEARPKLQLTSGAWECPQCNFINLARNMKCLECEEGRPKRRLTSGEWECPQCNFINFVKNVKCLECEEAQPKRKLTSGEWECPQCNFVNFKRNMKCLVCEEARPKLTRGAWECPQCNFINFARNITCLECEKARPKRQLTSGEWECPQCNFINWARNMKCLECEEGRPKRRLTSGKWECPQCKFINFARNMKCFECEAARPKKQLISGEWKMPLRNGANNNLNATFSRGLDEFLGRTSAHSEPHNNSSNSDACMPPVYSRNVENLFSSRTTFGFGENSNLNKGDSGLALDEDEEEQWFKEASCIDSARDFNKGDSAFALDDDEEERWFKKASSFGSTSYFNKGDSALAPDEDEEVRWFKKASSMDSTSDMNNVIPVKDFPEIMPHPECHDSQAADNNLYAKFSRGLDELLGQTATHSETNKNSSDSVAGFPPVAGPPSQQFCPPQRNSSSYVPFVTLPPGMFEKTPQSSEMPERGNVVTNNYKNVDVSGSKDYGTLGSLADRGKEQN